MAEKDLSAVAELAGMTKQFEENTDFAKHSQI